MVQSRDLAALMGPVLLVTGTAETVNMRIFDAITAPVVFLNGAILFAAGLAIVRAHNRWSLRWPVVVTAMGWLILALGLLRMMVPGVQKEAGDGIIYAAAIFVAVAGAFLTWKGYVSARDG
jgi:hypothetical protein